MYSPVSNSCFSITARKSLLRLTAKAVGEMKFCMVEKEAPYQKALQGLR